MAAYNATRPPARPREEKLAYNQRWHQENKRRVNEYYGEYRARLRAEMIAAYGGECAHCGEKDPIILVIDHIANDGKAERRENGHTGGYKMYLFLKRNGWPKDRHQLLCHNCNFRKEYNRRRTVSLARGRNAA